MRKVEILEDIKIIGCLPIPAGTQFIVERFNSKFVYVKYNNCTLQLKRKEIKVIY